MTVYRSMRFGRYVELLLTDLRSYRSPYASLPHSPDSLAGLAEPPEAPLTDLGDDVLAILAAGRTWADGNPPETIDVSGTEIANPRRDAPPVTMLGARQKAWFKNSLGRSDAVWKVWGNSVPALRLGLDLSRIDDLLPDPLLWPESTWDGFPNERNEMMAYLEENGITNIVSLSGDRHMHAASLVARDFLAEPLRYVIPDFTVSSISTTTRMEIPVPPIRNLGEDFASLSYYTVPEDDGTERRVPNLNVTLRHGVRSGMAVAESRDPAAAAEAAHLTPNPHIRYLETYAHGYGIGRFDAEAATVEFVAIDPPTRFEHHGRQGPPAQAPLPAQGQHMECQRGTANRASLVGRRANYRGFGVGPLRLVTRLCATRPRVPMAGSPPPPRPRGRAGPCEHPISVYVNRRTIPGSGTIVTQAC